MSRKWIGLGMPICLGLCVFAVVAGLVAALKEGVTPRTVEKITQSDELEEISEN